MKLIIEIPEEEYKNIKNAVNSLIENGVDSASMSKVCLAILSGTPVTPDALADMLMEERIKGELEQDIYYSKEVIDNVRCVLNVGIIDRRPCYCGAELRAVWREEEI